MKICMIGLGSIGQRHIKNIVLVAKQRNLELHIDALRNTKRELPREVEILLENEYYNIEELDNDYDIIFICNPTNLHQKTLMQIVNKTKHCFVEKPVFDHYIDLSGLEISNERIFYVACPLRHKFVIQEIKKRLDLIEDKVICARAICSSYLPNWRKNIDYRSCYSANKKMGGGVILDLIHEWDYLSYLFGKPEEVFGRTGTFSNLEIDVEDCAIYVGKYKDKLVELHLDYFGQKSERVLQLFLNKQRIDVDLIKNEILFYQNNELVEKVNALEEDFYINEMQYFFDCIEGTKTNFNSIYEANELLKIIGVTE